MKIDKDNYNQFDSIKFEVELESLEKNRFDCIAVIVMDSLDNRVSVLDLRTEELLDYSKISKKINIKGVAKNIGIMTGNYRIGLAIGSERCIGDFYNLIGFQVMPKSIYKNVFLPFEKNVSGNLAIDFNFKTSYE